MNCDAYLELISGHVDGINNEGEEFFLQRHLQHCPHCRELLAAMEEANALIAEPVAVPDDLSAKIMKQVRADAAAANNKRKRSFFTVVTTLATAALLALVVFTTLPRLNVPSMDSAIIGESPEYDNTVDKDSGGHDIKHRPVLHAEGSAPVSIDNFNPSAVEAALPLVVVFSADQDLTEQGTIWLSDIIANNSLESGTAVSTKTFYLRYSAAAELADTSDATFLLATEGTPQDDSFCLVFVIERAE